MQKLSVKEAIEQGYTYAMSINSEGELIPLEGIDLSKGVYVLTSKNATPFTISDDLILELVDDYLCNQDEVGDEEGHLNELASTVDYSDITKKINEAFSNTKYYYSTDIRLTK